MSPTIWPLVWVGFTTVIILNPFPVMSKPSRWWLIKNVSRLLVSGTRRVEVRLNDLLATNINIPG
jgi:hypothetical protein